MQGIMKEKESEREREQDGECEATTGAHAGWSEADAFPA